MRASVWFYHQTMQPIFNVCSGMPPDELYNFLLGVGDHRVGDHIIDSQDASIRRGNAERASHTMDLALISTFEDFPIQILVCHRSLKSIPYARLCMKPSPSHACTLCWSRTFYAACP